MFVFRLISRFLYVGIQHADRHAQLIHHLVVKLIVRHHAQQGVEDQNLKQNF